MNISEYEQINEEKYLDSVKSVIKSNIDKKSEKIEEFKRNVIKGKKHLWQNISEYNDVEMFTTMDERDLDVSIINEEILKVSKLERSLNEPYFGKVRFNREDIYVGLTTVEDDKKEYVYDWRAPISNLYYNYGLGLAHYETPKGIIEGNITLKRQFKIELGNLINAFDTDVTVDDELLQEVLLNDSSDKMKNIVSTIQKEQNDIIRASSAKSMIISGIAGSGKTSVALHRIAYLLYNNKNLTNKNVLIFSPNDVFTSYISNVLPELGEENVLSITKDRLFSKKLPKSKIETMIEFNERSYKTTFSDDIKDKFDLSYKEKLDKYIREYINSIVFTKKIGLKDKFITSNELNQMYKNLSKLSLSDRLINMANKICDLYDISEDNAERLYIHLKKMIDLSDDPIKLYSDFLGIEYNYEKVNYEDLTPIMYLYYELNGYPDYSYIKHIVIDEAQDYSLFDFYLLKKVFNSATFTILGDSYQRVNPYIKYDSLKSICELFNGSVYDELNKAYRSSKEIVEYTNKILGINADAVRRSTSVSVMERDNMDNINNDINDLVTKYKRIAIITKTNDECNSLYEKLESKDVGLISDGILKRVVIVPSYLSKGLEFDAVIVLNKNSYKENEKNLLYVACTRAEHALIVYK